MVELPGATYIMGRTRQEVEWLVRRGLKLDKANLTVTARAVTILPFAISRTEVTRNQFAKFAAATGYKAPDNCNWQNPFFSPVTESDPVVCINWSDATAYAKWLSKISGRRYRLPTEEEWEYAARAGSKDIRYWGYSDEHTCEYANVFDQTAVGDYVPPEQIVFPCNDGFEFAAPVGSFRPNGFGLYDMLGNAFEWTASCYSRDAANRSNVATLDREEACNVRVVRGGSWFTNRRALSASFRDGIPVGFANSEFGFRLARDL